MRRSSGVTRGWVRAAWRTALLAVVASVIPVGIALGAAPTGPLVIDNFNPSTASASGPGSFSTSGGVGTVTVPFGQSDVNCETLTYSYASAQNLTAVSSQIEIDFNQITSSVPTGNTAFEITETLTDSNGNSSTQSTGISASGGSAGEVVLPYNESGDKFNGNADLSDIKTIQAAFCSPSNRSSGSSTIQMTEIQADGLPPVVNKIAVTGSTTPTVGQATSYTVTAEDSSGNTVISDNDQVDISISNGTVPATAQLSSGVASFQAMFGAGGSQSITVTDGAAATSGTLDVTVAKLSQVIDFPAPGGGVVGGGESLSATGGGSGNAVVFSVDTAGSSPADACSVSGTTVSFAHAGSCVIDANQSGNDEFNAAPQVSRTVTVAKASQAIDFPAPGGGSVGGGESLSATGGGSGNPVVFSVDMAGSSPADACSVSGTNGTTVSFAHAGSCVIDANQSGNGDFNAAAQVSRTVTIAKLSQVIDFPAPGGGVVGGSESLSATGGGSGNPVVFSVDMAGSSPADACSVSGTNGTTVSFAHAGSCVIDANQSGNGDFDAAAQVSRTVTVAKASQAIDFPAPGGGSVGGGESLSATGGGSGNPVVFSVDMAGSSPADACSVSGTNGTTVSFAHAGSCVIDANQSGNGDFDAAAQVSRTVTVAKASQAIDFPAPGGGVVGGSESLSATGGGSGNTVVFSVDMAGSSPADACSVSGTTVSFAHAGSCVIDANQSGNGDFDAAAQVSRTVTVAKASQVIDFPAPGGGSVGGGESLSATGGGSGNTVVFSVDMAGSSPADACSVSGTNGTTVSFAHAGSCVIDANQSANGDFNAAPQVSQTVTVGKASQAIDFPAPGGGVVGGSESLSATGGGSGNAVVFSVDTAGSSPADACSVSGTTVSFAHAGSCVIDANQSGNDDFDAAPQVSRTVTVTAPPTQPLAPSAAAPAPTAPAAPAAGPLTISAIKATAVTVTWCKHCAYPNTRLNFRLSAGGDVRLTLLAKTDGRWKQVAVTTLHAHRGNNSFRIAGRWGGQLIPRRTIRLLVHVKRGTTWKPIRTVTLTVNSPYTTKILDRH